MKAALVTVSFCVRFVVLPKTLAIINLSCAVLWGRAFQGALFPCTLDFFPSLGAVIAIK
jgi:hypothetical protein